MTVVRRAPACRMGCHRLVDGIGKGLPPGLHRLDGQRAAVEKVLMQPIGETAFKLGIGTGERTGDCCAMAWDDFDGEYICVVQEKTGARVWIYCPARLRSYLAALPRAGRYILSRNLTQPLGKRAVQRAVAKVREVIGVKDGMDRLVPHGWRYTAAVQLAEAGCSDAEIQSVTGHKTLAMVAKYRARANQKAASKRAQQRRERNKDGT